jgi:sterol desaturase/sphingolipid hydroxylase (fatty acid hydroxylase superfamily)
VHIFKPPRNFLKALWRNHSIHHYKDDSILFGVSSPIWDYVYRSLPGKQEAGVE